MLSGLVHIDTGCTIVGVEITDSAVAVHTQPFSANTAFMLGNEVWQAWPST